MYVHMILFVYFIILVFFLFTLNIYCLSWIYKIISVLLVLYICLFILVLSESYRVYKNSSGYWKYFPVLFLHLIGIREKSCPEAELYLALCLTSEMWLNWPGKTWWTSVSDIWFNNGHITLTWRDHFVWCIDIRFDQVQWRCSVEVWASRASCSVSAAGWCTVDGKLVMEPA